MFATVFGLALMDFMYSSLWLHGYVYALNMNYTAVGHHNDSHLPDFQFAIFPACTRALAAAATVLAVHAFLRYTHPSNHTALLQMSNECVGSIEHLAIVEA